MTHELPTDRADRAPWTGARAPALGLPAWAVTWVSMLLATFLAVVVLGRLSLDGAHDAVEKALADHLSSQAGLADGELASLPVEVLSRMTGGRSGDELTREVDALAKAGSLRGLALLGPDGQVLGRAGRWIPASAERDLIARASEGEIVTGPLYSDEAGELYKTAYRPLTGHPGWVVAVEGSASTLGAVDVLEGQEWRVGAAVLALAAIVGGLLAALVSRPLSRLAREISASQPGAPPSSLGDYGFRELRQVAGAARSLLSAIRARDAELLATHRSEVDQLTRMAAEIAHEVGNPLNAVALDVENMALHEHVTERLALLERIRAQIRSLAAIVARLRDLTMPLRPQGSRVSLDEVITALHTEIGGLEVLQTGERFLELQVDRTMLTEILRNLLLNAAQAGARRVSVVAARDGAWLELRISDDGPGIADGEKDRVFAWFHTTRATGTGLGLPHARRIAEALGGSLDLLTPRPATFALRLPLEPDLARGLA